jgi:hypothetical protein
MKIPRVPGIIALFVLLLTSSCQSCRRRPPLDGQPPNGVKEVVFFDEPISYCVQQRSTAETGDVQVLVDGSGSMVGFDPMLPEIIKWSQHAVSAIHNSALNIGASRVCTFREREGVSGCTGMTGAVPPRQSHGNTNLHEAIASAQDYALTLIVTDGVAATGENGKGDCATGVDAACVARSLVNWVHGGDTSEDRGVWLVPLVAPYDGTFYTEEEIAPASFHSEDAIQKIRSDIPLDASIQNPQPGPGGNLIYHYRGPRSLLLVVLAKKSDIGRAAIQALWERAEYLNVRQMGELRNYSGGIAALTPVEVVPGFLNKVRWSNLKESDEPGASQGTLDVHETGRGDKTTVEVNCPNSGENSGKYTLEGSGAPGQVAGCVPIRVVPGASFDVRPARPEDDGDLHQFVKGFTLPAGSYSSLNLDLGCPTDTNRRCNASPILVQLVAFMRYGEAADRLASPGKTASTVAALSNLSTAHPSLEPHRINALSLIVTLFYREIANDARSSVLGSFDVCKK